MSSVNFSTLSVQEALPSELQNCLMAIYKGVNVAVYTVDKTEVNLTRQDLIELINVCRRIGIHSLIFVYYRDLSKRKQVHNIL